MLDAFNLAVVKRDYFLPKNAVLNSARVGFLTKCLDATTIRLRNRGTTLDADANDCMNDQAPYQN
jgi:hypothetical protein